MLECVPLRTDRAHSSAAPQQGTEVNQNLRLLDTRGADRPLIEALLHQLEADVALADIARLAEHVAPHLDLEVRNVTPLPDGRGLRSRLTVLCERLVIEADAAIAHECWPWRGAFVIKIDAPGRSYTLFSDHAVVEPGDDRLCAAIDIDDLAPFACVEDLPEEH